MNETTKRLLVASLLEALATIIFQRSPLTAILPAAAGAAIVVNVIWESFE